jgi:glutathione S-transferase
MLKLFHDWDAFCCIKVRFCLAEKAVTWEGYHVDLQKMEQLKPEYLEINPKGVVPTVVHDGQVITESSIINEYVDEVFPGPKLMPADPFARAEARLWIRFEENVLHPSVKGPTYELMLRRALAEMPQEIVDDRVTHATSSEQAIRLRNAAAKGNPPNLQEVETAIGTMRHALTKMESRLQQVPWLAGGEFSLADISAAPWIDRLEELNFAQLWSGKPAVQGWIARIKARKAYQEALPKLNQRIPTPLPHHLPLSA